jgi:hypothetical protein
VTSHRHELAQLTFPHAPSIPWQVARHLPLPQLSAPQALAPPEHVSTQPDVPLQLCVPHAPAPSHVRVHVPIDEQERLPQTALPPPPMQVWVQLPPLHVSEPHALLPVQAAIQLPVVQLMLPHALTPVQVMSQFFVAHVMPRHESAARQSMSQEAAFPHVIAPQAPACPHVMLHL